VVTPCPRRPTWMASRPSVPWAFTSPGLTRHLRRRTARVGSHLPIQLPIQGEGLCGAGRDRTRRPSKLSRPNAPGRDQMHMPRPIPIPSQRRFESSRGHEIPGQGDMAEIVAEVVHPIAHPRLRRRPLEGREWRVDGPADQDVEVDEELGGAQTYGAAHRLVDLCNEIAGVGCLRPGRCIRADCAAGR
jgi:hypothetical protein